MPFLCRDFRDAGFNPRAREDATFCLCILQH